MGAGPGRHGQLAQGDRTDIEGSRAQRLQQTQGPRRLPCVPEKSDGIPCAPLLEKGLLPQYLAGHLLPAQAGFKKIHLRRGAGQHGDFMQTPDGSLAHDAMAHAGDGAGHGAGFGQIVVGFQQLQRWIGWHRRGAPGDCQWRTEDGSGGGTDGDGTTIAALKFVQGRDAIVLGDTLQEPGVPAARSIDGLARITHDEQAAAGAGQSPDQLVLDGVDVLEFINQHVGETCGQSLPLICIPAYGLKQVQQYIIAVPYPAGP